jgi:DNA-binding FadR family transcriptional regulator
MLKSIQCDALKQRARWYQRGVRHMAINKPVGRGSDGHGDADSGDSHFQMVDKGVPVSVQVATQLIAAIESGQVALGSRLPSETVLTERFGVSRASVREALASLQFAGYLESRRGSGTTVCSTIPLGAGKLHRLGLNRPKDVVDLFEARLVVEPEAVAEAACAPVPSALKILFKLLDGRQLAVGRPELQARTDIGFHLALVRACPNPFLAQTSEALISRTEGQLWRTIRDQAWEQGDLPKMWLVHHKSLVDAIAQHDPEAAALGIRSHLLSVLDNVATTALLGPAERTRIARLSGLHRRSVES